MLPFVLLLSALFFVLGGLMLALPWKGLVMLIERMESPASPQDRRYAMLLALPLILLAGFVTVMLGPWETEVCQALQDACLERITAWQLPWELGVVLGLVGSVAAGPRLGTHEGRSAHGPWTGPGARRAPAGRDVAALEPPPSRSHGHDAVASRGGLRRPSPERAPPSPRNLGAPCPEAPGRAGMRNPR